VAIAETGGVIGPVEPLAAGLAMAAGAGDHRGRGGQDAALVGLVVKAGAWRGDASARRDHHAERGQRGERPSEVASAAAQNVASTITRRAL
jgi:hypothetical protein